MAMLVSVIQKQILKDSKNINPFSESLKKLFIQGHIFKSTFWKIPPPHTTKKTVYLCHDRYYGEL